eukprot:12597657-Alexandrium_andersonii.AAC.1
MTCAGFACQPNSGAGSGNGFDDRRADVLIFGVRFAGAIAPRVILLEHAAGFARGHGASGSPRSGSCWQPQATRWASRRWTPCGHAAA